MRRVPLVVGFVGSGAYLLLLYALLGQRLGEFTGMPLNEIGDFLAGVFGPLALFWLILGFLQQKDLVEVTRAQLEAELEALKREQLRQREAAKPKFVFGGVGVISGSQGRTFSAHVKNVGNTATNLSFRANKNVQINITNNLSWTRDQNKELKWSYEKGAPEEGVVLTINYVDALGFSGEQRFAFNLVHGGDHSEVEIVPIAG
jgi:hypothetical protein